MKDASSAEAHAFPFHHGRISLSFVGTVGDPGSLATERLPSPTALGAWLRAAEVMASDVEPTPAIYRRALDFREALTRVVRAVASGAKPKVGDVERINDAARRWAERPALDPRNLTLASGGREVVAAALGRVAVDAIELLGDAEERSRLRACALERCGALFLTPAGRRERRWCSMARCGNRAKVAAFRKRGERER